MAVFNFITSNGTVLTSSFEVKPVYFPTISGSKILTGDVLSSSVSPASMSLATNTYKVQYNDSQVANTWYVQNSGSLSLISGSTLSGSLCTVTFNLADMGLNPSTRSVWITPVNNSVMFNGSFVSAETLYYSTNVTGSLTVSLIQQPYNVLLKTKIKSTPFQISPSGSSCNAKDVIVSNVNVASVITPYNSASYGYTAQVSDNRYLLQGGSINSASYATTASFALNGGGSSGFVTQSLFATSSLFASQSFTANTATSSLSASYATSASFSLSSSLAKTANVVSSSVQTGIYAGVVDPIVWTKKRRN